MGANYCITVERAGCIISPVFGFFIPMYFILYLFSCLWRFLCIITITSPLLLVQVYNLSSSLYNIGLRGETWIDLGVKLHWCPT
jgi:hypothetical protein